MIEQAIAAKYRGSVISASEILESSAVSDYGDNRMRAIIDRKLILDQEYQKEIDPYIFQENLL